MPNFKSMSDDTEEKYVNGTLKRPTKPFRSGIEIEQAATRDSAGSACEPSIICPNPERIPICVPDRVITRSIMFGEGHYDGSRPWEFNLHHSIKEYNLLQKFNQIVRNDIWAWHNEFRTGGSRRGCSAHIHYSVVGHIDLGNFFGNQMVAPAIDWAIAWNNMVTLVPLTLPFYAFGRRFRRTGLTEWAKPVYDRFDHKSIYEIFEQHYTLGVDSQRTYNLGHDYTALSWNRHSQKAQVTIENRLNEGHPYWIIPMLRVFSLINNATIIRRRSVKLTNSYDTLASYWRHAYDTDVYKALLKMTNVTFLMPQDRSLKHKYRGLPYICSGSSNYLYGDDRIYPTALDLFRLICRRFKMQRKNSPIKMEKIMRMWGDFIDFNKVPAHLIWDVDTLYHLLYENEQRKRYQDEYLYFGSSVVFDDDDEFENPRWITSLI